MSYAPDGATGINEEINENECTYKQTEGFHLIRS
jgi:hypothetical protein